MSTTLNMWDVGFKKVISDLNSCEICGIKMKKFVILRCEGFLEFGIRATFCRKNWDWKRWKNWNGDGIRLIFPPLSSPYTLKTTCQN